MLFNSIDFAIFLPIVFALYWLIPSRLYKYQNILILLASYVFYGWWDYRFLALILFSTLVDFSLGKLIYQETSVLKRKLYLILSLIVNIGFLMYFKYYNFFLENFIEAFSFFGNRITSNSLNIILPVGISFYTFQTLSYTIDLYRKNLSPAKGFFAFSAYVSFFPQLVAGPIERATNLLPQFYEQREFDYLKAVSGLKQILWGLFKKILIADNCAEIANIVFNNSEEYSGSSLVLGAFMFTFQIYGDFSGYSDIAIGTSRLFGFNLMQNFAFPYFSRDIAEFWRRWHISLSTWFRDYLYIPLGGSKGNLFKKVRNTFIIFLISGFWHGANWTFIAWGFLNAFYFLPLLLSNKNRKNLNVINEGKLFPSFKQFLGILFTFIQTVIAWIFFRVESLTHAFSFISGIFSKTLFSIPLIIEPDTGYSIFPKKTLLLIVLFVGIEWIGRKDQFAIETLGENWKAIYRNLIYYSIIFLIFWSFGKEQAFIYFQF